MGSREKEFGIFICNDLLRDSSKGQQQRTVLLGQIVIIDARLPDRTLAVRFLKAEGLAWEAVSYICSEDSVIRISEKLWLFIASVNSPQERVKLAKNKELCEKLQRVGKDMVVGFTDTNDVLLGEVKYIGAVKGIGYCYGIELHEKRKENLCNGSCAGIQYFKSDPGYAVFTTIERVIPMNMFSTSICNGSPPTAPQSDLDMFVERNSSTIMNGTNDEKPKYEEIVTKYGEYPTKKFSANKTTNGTYLRSSLSLQNMLEINSSTVNTNNDFDQNSVIQPEKTVLVKKPKNNTELDLIDVIGGKWSGTTDKKQLDDFTGSMRKLDKNDNVKEKYAPVESNTLSRRNRSVNPFHHILDSSSAFKKGTSKFYTNDLSDAKEDYKTSTLKTKMVGAPV